MNKVSTMLFAASASALSAFTPAKSTELQPENQSSAYSSFMINDVETSYRIGQRSVIATQHCDITGDQPEINLQILINGNDRGTAFSYSQMGTDSATSSNHTIENDISNDGKSQDWVGQFLKDNGFKKISDMCGKKNPKNEVEKNQRNDEMGERMVKALYNRALAKGYSFN